MKTSVVMATFNGAAHIAEQMESLFHQSVLPDEMVVADDCSNDDTSSILKSIAKNSPFPIRLTQRTTRLGYAGNFSDAALLASHDVVFFCDQDDFWNPEKIRITKDWFRANPDKFLAIHNISVCDENLKEMIPDYFQHLDKNHARSHFLKGCATAARKQLTDAAFPLPAQSNWHHDTRVHALARFHENYGYIEEVLLKHRLHAANTSGFIIQNKGLGGRVMAKLDQWATDSSATWSKSIRLAPLHLTDMEVREFLRACSPDDLAAHLFDAVIKVQQKDYTLSTSEKSRKIPRYTKLLRFLLSGRYKDTGGFPQCLVDVIRLTLS